ncbi:contractile injection system tape measure protein [Photorhabdus australis]|uniref:contractile injection system tape measure protein n=1 Tax=Photorhabdus australis TaxID=286156 RepID=UPI00056073C7|nr:contractile injection system tape measure protein [Photorhabdus australis]
MISEKNLLNRITINIEADNQPEAKKILHGSLLNQTNIYKLFNLYFNEYTINQNVYLETLSLDLGKISLHDFNSLFPIRLNAALNRVFSQYYQNNNEDKIFLKYPVIIKNTRKPSLPKNDCLINAEEFIHYLYQKDFKLNSEKIMLNNINVRQLINQLTRMESKLTLLLAKICLSEYSLQRLLSINQPVLLTAINRKLSVDENISQHQGELVSSGQLILNALGYMQSHNIQEIIKPDTQVISRIMADLNQGILNISPVITLFRQAILTHHSSLNAWLAQLWQTDPIPQLCKKHLSIQQYETLVNRFSYQEQTFREYTLQQTMEVDPLLIQLLQILAIKPQQDLPPLNQHQLSLIATAIQTGEAKTENILQLLQHPALYNRAGTAWLAPLWQSASVSQICKKHLSAEKYNYLSRRFMPNNANQILTSQDQSILPAPDNLHIKSNNCSQLQTINRSRVEPILLTEKTPLYSVSNAGILILWPMLPALFNHLGLLEAQKFIHHQAQFSAVNLLDYLIWGDEEEQIERKALNNVLCGLMVNEDNESISLETEKQLITEQWLDAIIAQLFGWKKLSRNDVRQLFLQRPGELRMGEQEIKITIQHQPFDLLLNDWPWPLNIAKLPWLNQPLSIDWQNI